MLKLTSPIKVLTVDKDSTVTLAWETVWPQTAYEVLYRPVDSLNWSTLGKTTSSTTSITLDLSAFTLFEHYFYRVVTYIENEEIEAESSYNGVEYSDVYSIMVTSGTVNGYLKKKFNDSVASVTLYNTDDISMPLKARVDSTNNGSVKIVDSNSLSASDIKFSINGYSAALQGELPQSYTYGNTYVQMTSPERYYYGYSTYKYPVKAIQNTLSYDGGYTFNYSYVYLPVNSSITWSYQPYYSLYSVEDTVPSYYYTTYYSPSSGYYYYYRAYTQRGQVSYTRGGKTLYYYYYYTYYVKVSASYTYYTKNYSQQYLEQKYRLDAIISAKYNITSPLVYSNYLDSDMININNLYFTYSYLPTYTYSYSYNYYHAYNMYSIMSEDPGTTYYYLPKGTFLNNSYVDNSVVTSYSYYYKSFYQ